MNVISITYIPKKRRIRLGTLILEALVTSRQILEDWDDRLLRENMKELGYTYGHLPDVANYFCDICESLKFQGRSPPPTWARLKEAMEEFRLRRPACTNEGDTL